MLQNLNERVMINVPWSGKIVEVDIVLSDYEYELWDAKEDVKFNVGAKFEGIIKLKIDSPQNLATDMLHQISATTDRLAFFIF